MGIIRELDYKTVVKIAAGEVIDRPASVVRELIDNSIDAGAASISIHISGGGKGYIEVSDNGAGMDKDDLEICYKNHTTSKINGFDDISDLRTLGFRGEALSSIAETAVLNINSRKKDDAGGYTLVIENGMPASLKEFGMNYGTSVIVKNLFENIPARKKFLSTDSTEIKWIDREILKKALAFPGITFEFVVEGKRKYISTSKNTYLEKIADFFPDVLSNLIPVESISELGSIMGFVSKPAFIRPNRMYQMFFVNRRAVDWKNFYFSINNAYGNLIPRGYFPAVFIYLDVSPDAVDVNVHPMKREVRFRDDARLSKAIQEAIHKALTEDTGLSEAEDSVIGFTPFEKRVGEAISGFFTGGAGSLNSDAGKNQHYQNLFFSRSETPIKQENDSKTFESLEAQKHEDNSDSGSILDYRFIGVIFRTFIIMENEDSIVLLDQHAVHERINYEKLKNHYKDKLLTPVELLIPVNLDVPPGIVEDFKENSVILQSMGFDVEYFGGSSFIVRSAPAYIDYNDIGDVLMGFVETLEEDSGAHSVDFIDRALKQMACKSSIRGGEGISKEEVFELLREWEKTPNRYSCPHGRPVAFVLSRKDIEKQFKRLGF